MNAAFDPRAFVAEAVREHGPLPLIPSLFEAATLSLADAEDGVRHGVGQFYDEALAWRVISTALWRRQKAAKARLKQIREDQEFAPAEETDEQRALDAVLQEVGPVAPQRGLQVGLGVGKTYRTIQGARDYIAAAKRAKVKSGILWAAPTLAMADQTASDHRKAGTAAGVYRGRRAANPEAEFPPANDDDDRGRMCLDLLSVRLAADADLPVSTHVCGTGKPDAPNCPFRLECPFQRNNKALRKADVIVGTAAALFHRLDPALERRIGATVIDEAFWQQGLLTSSIPIEKLTADLDVAPVLDREGNPRTFATQQLMATMNEVRRVLEELPDGRPLGRELGGLNALRCREASREQFARVVRATMYPGQPIDERKEAARQGSRNRLFRGMAALLHALADHLDSSDGISGRIEMETADLAAGSERRVLIHGRKDFVARTLQNPTFNLDATMPVDAVRVYLPRLVVPPPIDAVTPHMRVVQVLSTRENRGGFGKTSVIPHPDLTDDEIRRRERRIAELRDYFAGLAQQLGDGLVITYLKLKHYFADIPGVSLGHFNAVAGLNTFERVRWVVVLGRPMPSPSDTALICKQLFGRWCEPERPEEVPIGLLTADGIPQTIRSRRFANEAMETVRAAITDNNVVQAIGRARGVRRTENSPVLILLMSDVAAPFPIDELTNWPDQSPNVMARMAARGVVLLGPKDAAAAYPDLFPNENAARMAISRCGGFTEQTPILSSNIGECSGNRFVPIRYRPQGRGQQIRRAFILDSRIPEVQPWLEGLLGPLALFEVGEPPDPPPPPLPDHQTPAEDDDPVLSDEPPPWEPPAEDLRPWWLDGSGKDEGGWWRDEIDFDPVLPLPPQTATHPRLGHVSLNADPWSRR